MKPKPISVLGQFEQLVMTAILAVGEDKAHGSAVQRKVQELYGGGKEVNMGSVYVTLERLQAKRFVKSVWSESLPQRGGRSRR